MNENRLAETCLCYSGIASGNMLLTNHLGNIMLTNQKHMIDQFYRTTGINPSSKRDSSSDTNKESFE